MSFGLGLRSKHYNYILKNRPKVDWFEIISENFMETEGPGLNNLSKIKEIYPLVMHGVSLSIGSINSNNFEYLSKLKKLIKYVNPLWISDHLCFTGTGKENTHDLLPIPYTEESLKHVIKKIKEVQDYLEMEIALENPSTYLDFKSSQIQESEFISRMIEGAKCKLLLDINNVYVTCFNHGLSPKKYIDDLDIKKIKQIHLSGHCNKGTHIIDTHDDFVTEEVWNLYKYTINKSQRIIETMIEWDDNIPEFPVLYEELQKAKKAAKNCKNYTIPNIKILPRINSRTSQSLESSQKIMQCSILKGQSHNLKASQWIIGKKNFSAKKKLSVYVNAYRIRLEESITEDFPVLKEYLGEEKFKTLVGDFVKNTTSTHYNLAKYSQKLHSFIKKRLHGDRFSQEICELESSILEIYDQEETSPLSSKNLNNLTEEDLLNSKLFPRKALKLHKFSHQINQYYQDVMDKNNNHKKIKRDSYLVVFRDKNQIWRMPMEKNEFIILREIFAGKKIGEVLKSSIAQNPDDIKKWFSRWINNNLLSNN